MCIERRYHAAICLFDALLGALGDALVGSVTGFEVDDCSPVIAFVIAISIARVVCHVSRRTEVLSHFAGRTR
jgi:hypothetical protein